MIRQDPTGIVEMPDDFQYVTLRTVVFVYPAFICLPVVVVISIDCASLITIEHNCLSWELCLMVIFRCH